MHRNSVQSIETFQVALYTEPEDQLLWIHLGEAYSRAGHHTAALKALTKVRELDPDDWVCTVLISEVQHQLKHHDPLYEAWKEEKDEDEHGSDDGCAHLFATDNVNVKLPPVPPRMLYIEIVGALLVSSWWLTVSKLERDGKHNIHKKFKECLSTSSTSVPYRLTRHTYVETLMIIRRSKLRSITVWYTCNLNPCICRYIAKIIMHKQII